MRGSIAVAGRSTAGRRFGFVPPERRFDLSSIAPMPDVASLRAVVVTQFQTLAVTSVSPFGAKKNSCICGNHCPTYSITASARPISGSGTTSPSAFAVLRLKINSTFVVCCTGRFSGFSPLRIRAA
jgi:hypothetical protein